MCNVALCELYLGVMIGLSWGRARRRDISPRPSKSTTTLPESHLLPCNTSQPILLSTTHICSIPIALLESSICFETLFHRGMTCDCWWQTWHRNCCNWWSGRGAICFGRKRRCIGKLLDAGSSPVVRGSSLVSSVRSSTVYHGLIEIRAAATHFFKFFKFFRF